MADAKANQVLRATQQTEQLEGPLGWRVNTHRNGNTRLLLSQWPVLSVSQIQYAVANSFPLSFSAVTANHWFVERPPLLVTGSSAAADSGTGGQAVQVGPGYIAPNGSYVIDTTYIAGWPHAGITVAGERDRHRPERGRLHRLGTRHHRARREGCTGVIYDQAGNQEAVTCLAASATSGPGVLTLAAPLQYAHDPGITVSALPGQIQWATACTAASLALTRGATATKIQDIAGTGGATAAGARGPAEAGRRAHRPIQEGHLSRG